MQVNSNLIGGIDLTVLTLIHYPKNDFAVKFALESKGIQWNPMETNRTVTKNKSCKPFGIQPLATTFECLLVASTLN